ncbi:DUF1003 domain-containing protein [Dictyobacter arantiisoli]|uniref:Cyclic nucleotide-binding domain-containing protein n=1 Tax=Dictyobacter arantiisoli TaxID=2014874 RepID=A0A5A5TAP6_9CHLR|nr:DUF1003 domain-containing protein [Dictyobacter arantiisoli]GCF08427.1 hypothetical protein KDI_19910 [Dictyobacter arantiisoli]
MTRTTIHELQCIPLFSNMDEEELQELHSIMTEQIFQPGQIAMKAGEVGSAFHIIESGEAEVWLTDSDGKKVMLDLIGPGKFFGELSMLSGDQRSASATSQGELVTLALEREEFFAFLRRRPDASLDVLTELAERLKHTDDILRTRVSKNPNDAADEHISNGQRLADAIAEWSGSIPFLLLNAVVFALWILINSLGPAMLRFDPYPYQFLTMSVSLEAIFLSIFVLVSQNRQGAKDRLKADLDYQIDVKAEFEMTTMAEEIRDIHRQLHLMQHEILNSTRQPIPEAQNRS